MGLVVTGTCDLSPDKLVGEDYCQNPSEVFIAFDIRSLHHPGIIFGGFEMLRLIALLTLILIGFAGCRTIPVDVSHAYTDKGYLNSGLRTLGQLYLLDTEDGSLKELAVLDLSNRVRGATFEEQFARNVRGVDIGAGGEVGIDAEVKASITRNSYIRLTNAFDETYANTFGDLSAEINRREAIGEDVGFTWFLDDATKPGSTIRYLLVYSTIRADEAVIGYNNVTAVDGNLTVPVRGRAEVDVTVSGLSEESWKGKAVPVLVDYHVIQAFQDDGFYKFRIDRAFRDDDLTDILKGRRLPPAEEEDFVARRR